LLVEFLKSKLYCHVANSTFSNELTFQKDISNLDCNTHCNTLQHTATHCTTPKHTATHCNTLQHTAAHCSTLQHTATHCNTLQHTFSNELTFQKILIGFLYYCRNELAGFFSEFLKVSSIVICSSVFSRELLSAPNGEFLDK